MTSSAKNRLLHDVEEMGVAANEDGGIADISADVAQVATMYSVRAQNYLEDHHDYNS
jgi:hypothetical protein